MKSSWLKRILPVLAVLLVFSGCVPTTHKASPEYTVQKTTRNILLMPLDIELSLLTAGGVQEPNALWTANAKNYVKESIAEFFGSNNIKVSSWLDAPEGFFDPAEENLVVQIMKLHEAVGTSILLHQYMEKFALPNKNGRFDWSLGSEARLIERTYKGADYALFVFLRDSYSSAGRVALFIAASAFGVGIPMGHQIGFASLVDLKSGQIVWFNRLARGFGDLRNKEKAARSVDALLEDFPFSS